ncbi:S1C family serine protease [Aquabacterium sp.]|uniref:S1C family serine protease n=1 Tax=Aquabacterium sp. TaxID=1872578 RepID=UPI002C7738C9|nr:S1C family serine protease [Aquabacterium sp.]HSW08285.1 S1C family serine protease [Aquabacterium sp.]
MKPRLPRVSAVAWTALLAVLAAFVLTWSQAALAADSADATADLSDRSRALQRAQNAVVGVQAMAVEGARSTATLGPVRNGSGVVIGPDGLVLTIGYLVLEADQVQIVTDDERTIPARVIGYDVATGFGLVQALAPLRIEAAPLGRSAALAPREVMMIASGGEDGAVSPAWLVSRRAFSGYWEYHITGALFTTPPRRDHSGAGLFNAQGELVGIGSLVLADAAPPEDPDRVPGNMFVPVDLLSPILDELRRVGSSASSRRAWLGVNCVEQNGDVRVVRVNDDSPADVAGLKAGDQILRVDGTEVHALEALWTTLWSGGAPEREVVLDIRRDGTSQTVKVFSVDRMKTLKRPRGI